MASLKSSMSLFWCILAIVLGLACGLNDEWNDQDANAKQSMFVAWKERHGKTYDSLKEHQKRLAIYLNNDKTVDRHNQAFEKGWTSFAMTMDSPFADLTDDEFTTSYLMAGQNCSATHKSSGKLAIKGNPLPRYIDWRTRGIITPIKDQKKCGSCWTFSTTGTLEAHTCLHDKTLDCTTWPGLAEQQLLDCASAYDNHGCGGGLPSHAFEYIKSAGGLDTEASYDYKATDKGPCQFSSHSVGARVAEVFNITSRDEDDLVSAIAQVGPVSVAYQVSHDFRLYSHGVYDSFNATTNQTMCKSGPMDVNHAVVAVGYGGTVAGVPFYIVRNSWGKSWGMEGYFWMLRGKNLCGVSDCASFPIVPTTTTTKNAAAIGETKNMVDISDEKGDVGPVASSLRRNKHM